jgi:hypothetical protein
LQVLHAVRTLGLLALVFFLTAVECKAGAAMSAIGPLATWIVHDAPSPWRRCDALKSHIRQINSRDNNSRSVVDHQKQATMSLQGWSSEGRILIRATKRCRQDFYCLPLAVPDPNSGAGFTCVQHSILLPNAIGVFEDQFRRIRSYPCAHTRNARLLQSDFLTQLRSSFHYQPAVA